MVGQYFNKHGYTGTRLSEITKEVCTSKNDCIIFRDSQTVPTGQQYNQITKDKPFIERTLVEGSEKALSISGPIIEEVRKAIGIKGF